MQEDNKRLGFGTIVGAVWLVGIVVIAIVAGPTLLYKMAKSVDVPTDAPAGLQGLATMLDFPGIEIVLGLMGILMLWMIVSSITTAIKKEDRPK